MAGVEVGWVRTRVGVEQVVTRHPRLAGNAGGNNHQIAAFQAPSELVWASVSSDCDRRVAMAEIRCYALCAGNVVQRKLRY